MLIVSKKKKKKRVKELEQLNKSFSNTLFGEKTTEKENPLLLKKKEKTRGLILFNITSKGIKTNPDDTVEDNERRIS